MCLTRVYENSHLSIITTVLGLEILPYVKPTTIDTELLLTYKSNMVQVDNYNDIKTSELDNNKVVQVISTSSYIFSDEIVDNIFNQQSKPAKSSTKYIEVSYEDAISVSQSQIWARFKIVYLIILRIGQLINKDGQLTWDLVVMQDWISVIFGWNWSSI